MASEDRAGDELTLAEVVSLTGITVRNVKFWSACYDLEVRRAGRKNYYPRRTVELLRAVHELSELHLFSTNFIRWLVDRAMGRAPEADSRLDRYRRRRKALSGLVAFPLPEPFPDLEETAPPQRSAEAESIYRPMKRRSEEDALL